MSAELAEREQRMVEYVSDQREAAYANGEPFKGYLERGFALRARLAKLFPKVTWTYAFSEKGYSHIFTAAFDLMVDDMTTFNIEMSDEMSDEMLQKASFQEEIVVYVARSMAHGIAEYLLEGVVEWDQQ